MLAQFQALLNFIKAMRQSVGDDATFETVKSTQVSHIIHLLARQSIALPEASTIMELMSSPAASAILNDDDKKRIGMALSESMARPFVDSAASPSGVDNRKMQTHMYMYNYLTQQEWDLLRGSARVDAKLSVIVDRSLSIGLVMPSELTFVSMIALLIVAGGHQLSANDAYDHLQRLKKVEDATVGGDKDNGHLPGVREELHGQPFDDLQGPAGAVPVSGR